MELAKPSLITRIVLYNRADCCGRQLSNFHLSVLDQTEQEVFGEDYPGVVMQGGAQEFHLPEGTKGKVVKIQLNGWNLDGDGYLPLAEVQVLN